MMQKPVRYYITEAEDRPVVRTVSVAVRQEPNGEQRAAEVQVSNTENQHQTSKRSRLRERLKSTRQHDDS
jgi:hypothetical protein